MTVNKQKMIKNLARLKKFVSKRLDCNTLFKILVIIITKKITINPILIIISYL